MLPTSAMALLFKTCTAAPICTPTLPPPALTAMVVTSSLLSAATEMSFAASMSWARAFTVLFETSVTTEAPTPAPRPMLRPPASRACLVSSDAFTAMPPSPPFSFALEASAMTVLLFTSTSTTPFTEAPRPPETPAAPSNWVSAAFAPTYTPCT